MVLEGVSRGGLYVYRWAKNHPNTVACVYNDTPVCDFKSWPGGKGQGKGAQGEWKRLLKEYGFKDEAEAMAYEDNPIDNLQPIVDARIPIMHIVTEDDAIVPPRENTYVLKERLENSGFLLYVISIEKGDRQTDTTSMSNTLMSATTLFVNTAISPTPIRFIYVPV